MSLEIQNKQVRANCKPKNEMLILFEDILTKIDQSSLTDIKKFIPIQEIIRGKQPTDSKLLAQYINQIVFYLSKQKIELQSQILDESQYDDQQSYESLIQKLENDVRQHISIEQQQRLYIEGLENKLDEAMQLYEEDSKKYQQEIESLKRQLNQKSLHKYTKSSNAINYVTSAQSSVPSTKIRLKSGSDQYQDDLERSTNKQSISSKKQRQSNCQMPRQIQALLQKVHTEGDRSVSRSRKSNNGKQNQTNYQKEIKQIEQTDIVRNLQQQFEESDRLKDIEKYLTEAYISQRDTVNDVSDMLNYSSQKLYFSKLKKSSNNQIGNKSVSYDGTSKQKLLGQSREKLKNSQKSLSLIRQQKKQRNYY